MTESVGLNQMYLNILFPLIEKGFLNIKSSKIPTFFNTGKTFTRLPLVYVALHPVIGCATS